MEGKLKILMTADSIGGVWTFACDLCRELGECAEIHLAVMGGFADENRRKSVGRLPNVTLYESEYRLEWQSDPWADLHQAKEWLISIYHRINPDIIHFNNFGQVDYPWDCPVVTTFHSCVQTWWQAVKFEAAPDDWNRYRQLVAKALTFSDVVVFPSQSIKGAAERIYGTEAESRVIYNGCELKLESALLKEPIVFCAGRVWDEAKNIKLLIDAADEIEWPIYIAGDHSGFVGKQSDNVRFLGQLSPEEVRFWMQKAAIYVNPALYEPFGLSVLEAASAGCALALSQIETLTEIWKESALYFDPLSPTNAAAVVNSLIGNYEVREQLSKRAQSAAIRFSAQTMANQYKSIYEHVLQNQPQLNS